MQGGNHGEESNLGAVFGMQGGDVGVGFACDRQGVAGPVSACIYFTGKAGRRRGTV